MLHSFYSFDYILKLPLKNIARLLIKAMQKQTDNLLMQRWLLHYENEIGFEDFKDKLIIHRTQNEKTEEEILIDVKEILETFNKEVI